VIRGRPVRTTISDKAAPSPQDRVSRQFYAERPNQLWVSDFTYVSTWQGFVYVAFVIDVYARRIVGWKVSRTAHTDFVLDALEQALCDRRPVKQALIHHSDRGTQYVSIRYTERLADAGIEPSVGSVGDSYDNALAETINGSTRPRSSTADPGRVGKMSNWPRWRGCTGTTIDACSRRSIIEHRLRPKLSTINHRAHCARQRDSNQTASGKTGAVHSGVSVPQCQLRFVTSTKWIAGRACPNPTGGNPLSLYDRHFRRAK
jgi:putative transposase